VNEIYEVEREIINMGYEIGDRVGTISHTDGDGDVVYIFGFGVYEGNHVPAKGIGGFFDAPVLPFCVAAS
jgi:hypothetical protein